MDQFKMMRKRLMLEGIQIVSPTNVRLPNDPEDMIERKGSEVGQVGSGADPTHSILVNLL